MVPRGPEGAIPATFAFMDVRWESEPSSEAVPFGVLNYVASYPQSWSLNPMGASLRHASNGQAVCSIIDPRFPEYTLLCQHCSYPAF